MLGARKQVFAAMEMVGTTPSVLSTLRKSEHFFFSNGSVMAALISFSYSGPLCDCAGD